MYKTDFYDFSCEDVQQFLYDNPDAVDALKHQYNTADPIELSYIVDDSDLIKLGMDPALKKQHITLDFENKTITEESYKFSDVNDIAKFLAHDLDDYETRQLIDKYQCSNFEELALALTDDELSKLGYKDKVAEDIVEYNDDIIDFDNNNDEYCEELDYLEDIPQDVRYCVVDPEEGILLVAHEVDFNRFCESLDPTLIEDCSPLPDIIEIGECFAFQVKPKIFEDKNSLQISEEVIINNTLNPNIFDEEHKMLPEVVETLTNYVNGFIEKMTSIGVDLKYTDICLIGSNAGYLYTPESDIDVHIISANPIDTDTAEKLFNYCDIYEAENPLEIGGANVELGIEDGYDIIVDNKDERRYSILENKWINDSDKLEQYQPEDIDKISGYEKIVDDYTAKINNAIDNDEFVIANNLKQEIRQNRSNDLANIGSLSMGNVVFKELRNNGAYGKLRTYLLSKDILGEQQDD